MQQRFDDDADDPPPFAEYDPPSPAADDQHDILNETCDVFPQNTLRRENLRCNKRAPFYYIKQLNPEIFKTHMAQARPFILFKPPRYENVTYHVGPQDNRPMDDANLRRLDRLLKSISKLNVRTGQENVSWTKLNDIYQKYPIFIRKAQTTINVRNPHQDKNATKERDEHADVRLGFQFDNMFAVKANFTFGERRTNSDEYHVIQTYAIPLLYNEPLPEHKDSFLKAWDRVSGRREACFDPAHQVYYNTYVLNPFNVYKIPENTVYIIITLQKTLFAIDRIERSLFTEMMERDPRWRSVVPLIGNLEKKLIADIHFSRKTLRPPKRGRPRKNDFKYRDELKPPEFHSESSNESQIFESPSATATTTTAFIFNRAPQSFQQESSPLSTSPSYILPSSPPSQQESFPSSHPTIESLPSSSFQNQLSSLPIQNQLLPSTSQTQSSTLQTLECFERMPPSPQVQQNFIYVESNLSQIPTNEEIHAAIDGMVETMATQETNVPNIPVDDLFDWLEFGSSVEYTGGGFTMDYGGIEE